MKSMMLAEIIAHGGFYECVVSRREVRLDV